MRHFLLQMAASPLLLLLVLVFLTDTANAEFTTFTPNIFGYRPPPNQKIGSPALTTTTTTTTAATTSTTTTEIHHRRHRHHDFQDAAVSFLSGNTIITIRDNQYNRLNALLFNILRGGGGGGGYEDDDEYDGDDFDEYDDEYDNEAEEEEEEANSRGRRRRPDYDHDLVDSPNMVRQNNNARRSGGGRPGQRSSPPPPGRRGGAGPPPPLRKRAKKKTPHWTQRMASKTLGMGTSVVMGTVKQSGKLAYNIVRPKHVELREIAGLWRLDQQVIEGPKNAPNPRILASVATFVLDPKRRVLILNTVVTPAPAADKEKKNSRQQQQQHKQQQQQSKKKKKSDNEDAADTQQQQQQQLKRPFQFQKTKLGSYRTEFVAPAFLVGSQPRWYGYKGTWQRKLADPKVIKLVGKIYIVRKQRFGKDKGKFLYGQPVGTFVARRRVQLEDDDYEDDDDDQYDYEDEYDNDDEFDNDEDEQYDDEDDDEFEDPYDDEF